jgi:chemotaxis protein methyltransferase CheR
MNLAPAPAPSLAWSDEMSGEEADFVRWVFDQAGLDARNYRTETLRRRYSACLRMLRVAEPGEARQRLVSDPDLLGSAIGTMVIGVTWFFRDTSVFDRLRDQILPLLAHGAGHPSVWSLGCSDGVELYSVAMLLGEMGALGEAHLLGTDCRPPAIARARSGTYDTARLRDVPPPWAEKYFAPEGAHHFRASAELRRAAQWRVADVTRLPEPNGWDLILCRNMAMYFRPDIAGRLWTQLEHALRPGGFLVLGKAERPFGAARLTSVGPCTYRKQ